MSNRVRGVLALALIASGPMVATSARAAALPSYAVTDLGDFHVSGGSYVDEIMVGMSYLPRFDAAGHVTRYGDRFIPPLQIMDPSTSAQTTVENPVQTYASGRYSVGWSGPVGWNQGNLGYLSDGVTARAIGQNLIPYGVNGDGTAVGMTTGTVSGGQGQETAFLYTKALGVTGLGTLGGPFSQAYAINDQNQIVGSSALADGKTHAFLDASGALTDLNKLIPSTSGWTLNAATDINQEGQILGYGTNPQGSVDDFLLTPTPSAVPEPTTLATLLGAGGGLALLRLRKSSDSPPRVLANLKRVWKSLFH